jgi:sarcosine oxidase subunit beta
MLATQDFDFAAYEPESGYADPSQTAASFLRAAQAAGAHLIQECPVTAIRSASGVVGGVATPHGDFAAPIVINAAGPWAGPVARLAGLDLPLDTWRHDIAYLRRPAELAGEHPTVIDEPESMYFRPETGGLTLVGLEDGNPIGLSPDGSGGPPEGFAARAADRMCRRIPGMEQGSLHSVQGGFDGITPDQRPLIGPAGPEGFFLDCGFSGAGFKIAPAVGESLAARILEGQYAPVDLSPFDPLRFSRGEHLRGENPYEMNWR